MIMPIFVVMVMMFVVIVAMMMMMAVIVATVTTTVTMAIAILIVMIMGNDNKNAWGFVSGAPGGQARSMNVAEHTRPRKQVQSRLFSGVRRRLLSDCIFLKISDISSYCDTKMPYSW